MVLAALSPLGLQARGIADIVSSLRNGGDYHSKVNYSVTLPQNNADVVYDIDLTGLPAEGDTFAPCRYVIDWTLDTPSGPVSGFSAYFDGNHYRYRGDRLQEYHLSWDSIPFKAGSRTPAIQNMAQFVELLPAYIAADLERMEADGAYRVTVRPERIFNGSQVLPVTAVMTVGGEDVMEVEYLFDSATLRPVRYSKESNPGSITEQTIMAVYTPAVGEIPPVLDEGTLMEAHPEVFEKYRESNFRIENLRGLPVPEFALPQPDGGRMIHHRGERFKAPTVIALLDPTTGMNRDVINALRGAMDQLEIPAEIIFAFTGTNSDAVHEIVPTVRHGEHLLLNARSLVRDCGAASLPVTIIAGEDGVVKNVVLGLNNELGDIVLQSVILSN